MEGGGVVHLIGGVPCVCLAIGQGEFPDLPFGTEIKFLEIYPEYIGAQGRFKIVYKV